MFPLGSQRKKTKRTKKAPTKAWLLFAGSWIRSVKAPGSTERTGKMFDAWGSWSQIGFGILKKNHHSKGRPQQSGFPFSNELRILSRVFLMRSAVSRADGFWYQHSFISFTRAERVLWRGNKKTNTRTSQELRRKFVTLAVVQKKKKKSVESHLIRGEGRGSGVCLTCSRLDF